MPRGIIVNSLFYILSSLTSSFFAAVPVYQLMRARIVADEHDDSIPVTDTASAAAGSDAIGAGLGAARGDPELGCGASTAFNVS